MMQEISTPHNASPTPPKKKMRVNYFILFLYRNV